MRRGNMYCKGKKVTCIQLTEALSAFLNWLKLVPNPILFAHNGKAFDSRVLWNSVERCNMGGLYLSHVTGWVDTLPLLKEMLPGSRSYSLSHLVDDLFGRQSKYDAHNALADVKALRKLIEFVAPGNELVVKHSFTLQSVADAVETRKLKHDKLLSLEPLYMSGTLSKYMAEKMASSGIDYDLIEQAFIEERQRGIENLLSEDKENGKVAITKQSKVVESLAEYFKTAVVLE